MFQVALFQIVVEWERQSAAVAEEGRLCLAGQRVAACFQLPSRELKTALAAVGRRMSWEVMAMA